MTNQPKIHGLRTSYNLYDSAYLILLEVNPFHLSALSTQDYFIFFAIELCLFWKSQPVRTGLYGLAINQSNCEKAIPYQLGYNNMLYRPAICQSWGLQENRSVSVAINPIDQLFANHGDCRKTGLYQLPLTLLPTRGGGAFWPAPSDCQP